MTRFLCCPEGSFKQENVFFCFKYRGFGHSEIAGNDKPRRITDAEKAAIIGPEFRLNPLKVLSSDPIGGTETWSDIVFTSFSCF